MKGRKQIKRQKTNNSKHDFASTTVRLTQNPPGNKKSGILKQKQMSFQSAPEEDPDDAEIRYLQEMLGIRSRKDLSATSQFAEELRSDGIEDFFDLIFPESAKHIDDDTSGSNAIPLASSSTAGKAPAKDSYAERTGQFQEEVLDDDLLLGGGSDDDDNIDNIVLLPTTKDNLRKMKTKNESQVKNTPEDVSTGKKSVVAQQDNSNVQKKLKVEKPLPPSALKSPASKQNNNKHDESGQQTSLKRRRSVSFYAVIGDDGEKTLLPEIDENEDDDKPRPRLFYLPDSYDDLSDFDEDDYDEDEDEDEYEYEYDSYDDNLYSISDSEDQSDLETSLPNSKTTSPSSSSLSSSSAPHPSPKSKPAPEKQQQEAKVIQPAASSPEGLSPAAAAALSTGKYLPPHLRRQLGITEGSAGGAALRASMASYLNDVNTFEDTKNQTNQNNFVQVSGDRLTESSFDRKNPTHAKVYQALQSMLNKTSFTNIMSIFEELTRIIQQYSIGLVTDISVIAVFDYIVHHGNSLAASTLYAIATILASIQKVAGLLSGSIILEQLTFALESDIMKLHHEFKPASEDKAAGPEGSPVKGSSTKASPQIPSTKPGVDSSTPKYLSKFVQQLQTQSKMKGTASIAPTSKQTTTTTQSQPALSEGVAVFIPPDKLKHLRHVITIIGVFYRLSCIGTSFIVTFADWLMGLTYKTPIQGGGHTHAVVGDDIIWSIKCPLLSELLIVTGLQIRNDDPVTLRSMLQKISQLAVPFSSQYQTQLLHDIISDVRSNKQPAIDGETTSDKATSQKKGGIGSSMDHILESLYLTMNTILNNTTEDFFTQEQSEKKGRRETKKDQLKKERQNAQQELQMKRGILNTHKERSMLAISFHDLYKVKETGRWWIATSAFRQGNTLPPQPPLTGSTPGDTHPDTLPLDETDSDDDSEDNLFFANSSSGSSKGAASQSLTLSEGRLAIPSHKLISRCINEGFVTPQQQEVYTIVMSSFDHNQAYSRLIKAKHYKPTPKYCNILSQIIMHCSMGESDYKTYYSAIFIKLCQYNRDMRFSIVSTFWDTIKLITMDQFQHLLDMIREEQGLSQDVQITDLDSITNPRHREQYLNLAQKASNLARLAVDILLEWDIDLYILKKIDFDEIFPDPSESNPPPQCAIVVIFLQILCSQLITQTADTIAQNYDANHITDDDLTAIGENIDQHLQVYLWPIQQQLVTNYKDIEKTKLIWQHILRDDDIVQSKKYQKLHQIKKGGFTQNSDGQRILTGLKLILVHYVYPSLRDTPYKPYIKRFIKRI